MIIAGRCLTHGEPQGDKEFGVGLRPVHRRVAGAGQREVQLPNHFLTAALPVFTRDLDEHWSRGWSVEARSFDVRRHADEILSRIHPASIGGA